MVWRWVYLGLRRAEKNGIMRCYYAVVYRLTKEDTRMSTIITAIDRHSPAEWAGIQVGEQLLTINGHTIVDVLDYRFYGYDALSLVEVKTAAGQVRTLTIRKAEGQDLGLNFDTYLMDEMRFCSNHCIFCFVDQMPPGMRSTLYYKDDDARLSFLLGNYTTLTNLTEREAQRIIDLHISPINVSVHATDPKLHCTMLGNKQAARSLEQDFLSAMRLEAHTEAPSPFTIATGTAAAPFMTYLLEQARAYFPALRGQVIAVENDFFGHTIDVAGLLTGQDLSAQLQKVPDLSRVLLPLHMLRHGENVFLDDYTVERLSGELGCPVQIVGIDGGDLLDAMLEREE